MRTWISVIVAVLLIGSGLVGVLDLQSMLRPAEKAHSGPIVDGEATVPAEVSPVKVATAPIRSRPIPVKATPIAPEAEPETIVLDDDWGGTDAPVAEAPKPAPQHPLLVKVEPVDRKADAVTVVTPQIKAPAARPVRRALTADAPPTVEVRMRHEARVSGQRVLLSHVAEVSAAPGIDIPAPNTVQVAEIGAKSTEQSLPPRPDMVPKNSTPHYVTPAQQPDAFQMMKAANGQGKYGEPQMMDLRAKALPLR